MGLPVEKQKFLARKITAELSAVILTGEDKGKTFLLKREGRLLIGRGKTCDIVLHDTKSSREHAEIVFVNGQYIITDLKSQNGIMVNQQKTLQAVIDDGDKLIIGQTWIRILAENSSKVDDSVQPTKKTNKIVFYILLFLFVVLIFVIPDSEHGDNEGEKGELQTGKKFSEVNSELIKKITDQQRQGDRDLQKNIDTIIKRGLRELREKNYYRATLEFTHALDLSPKDPQASFYLRKTYDELDQVIKELNLAALRDIESLHYKRAIISYCAIMRLLYNFKQDKRYDETKEKIFEVELKMGKEKGETSCY